MRQLASGLKVALLLAITVAILARAGKAADGPDQLLPDADYPKLVKHLAKGIQDALKGSPKEEQVTKARTAAIMIAAAAQQDLKGADAGQRATVRDAALMLIDTIRLKDYALASKQAGALPTLAADSAAQKEKVKLDRLVKTRELMNQFNHPPEGGWGIERKLYAYRLGMKPIPGADLKDQLMLEGYQVALTLDLLHQRAPDDARQKEWSAFADIVRKGGVQLALAVKAKDAGASMEAVAKITTTCSQCHKAFRANK